MIRLISNDSWTISIDRNYDAEEALDLVEDKIELFNETIADYMAALADELEAAGFRRVRTEKK